MNKYIKNKYKKKKGKKTLPKLDRIAFLIVKTALWEQQQAVLRLFFALLLLTQHVKICARQMIVSGGEGRKGRRGGKENFELNIKAYRPARMDLRVCKLR